MRGYIGRHHIAQPQPPRAQRADRFFWRGVRVGFLLGAPVWLLLAGLIVVLLNQ